MNIPELPTDNLYKFVALAGLFFIFSAFLPFLHSHYLQVDLINALGESAVLKLEAKWLQEDISDLKGEVESELLIK